MDTVTIMYLVLMGFGLMVLTGSIFYFLGYEGGYSKGYYDGCEAVLKK